MTTPSTPTPAKRVPAGRLQGGEILSSLRAIFPNASSFLMDLDTLGRWRHLAVPGTGQKPDIPPHLTEPERQAYLCCRDENLRLEQERIPQDEVLIAAKYLLGVPFRRNAPGAVVGT
jgi:hypothetical protein